MVDFIDAHREAYGLEPICAELPIAPSTYYEYKARQADASRIPVCRQRDEALDIEIKRVWEDSFQVYGARNVWCQLQRKDFEVARCTVERLMRRRGLRGVVRGRQCRTTKPAPAAACPQDRVQRQFNAERPLAAWQQREHQRLVATVLSQGY